MSNQSKVRELFASILEASDIRAAHREVVKGAADATKEAAKQAAAVLAGAGIPTAQLAMVLEAPKQFVNAACNGAAPEGRAAKESAIKAYTLFSQWSHKPAGRAVMADLCAVAGVNAQSGKDEWNSGRQRLATILRAIIATAGGVKAKPASEKLAAVAKSMAKLAVESSFTEDQLIKAIKAAMADAQVK